MAAEIKPGFISDSDMEKMSLQNPSSKKPGFISDSEMQSMGRPLQESTGKQIIRSALGALPTAGMIAGGVIGTPADIAVGPLGTAAGAAMGGALGKSLQNAGESLFLGDKKTTNDLLVGPAVEGISSGAAEMGGALAGKGLGAIAESKAGQAAGKYVGNKLSNAAAKVGELFTGVSDKEIKTYAKNADEIMSMAKASDNNTAMAADELRNKWTNQVQDKRKLLNSDISNALKSSEKTVDSTKIINSLESSKLSIDKDLYPEQVSQIDDIINKIKTKVGPDGQMPIQDANKVKLYLQDKASSAYNPNAIFPLGTEAAKAAKSGAANARLLVNEAEPAVAQANSKLSQLHDIEDSMNMNMLTAGKPEASIISAGSGANYRNVENLKNLGNLTGNDMLGDAEKLAAMRTFGSPKLMAADSTGKAVGRMGLAAGLGFITGGPGGAVAASALTSPAALKAAIDAGKIGGETLIKLSKDPIGRSLLVKAGIKPDKIQDLIQEQQAQELPKTDNKSPVDTAQNSPVSVGGLFPKVVRKQGFTAIVHDQNQLNESQKEGWK